MSKGPWKHTQAARGYYRKTDVAPVKHTAATPHAMPGITLAMLTGARAPVAKVRS